MKVLKHIGSIAGTLFWAGCMFFCFVAGAPETREALEDYVFCTAGFSLIFSGFLNGCIHYILYLQKKVEKLEEMLGRYKRTDNGQLGEASDSNGKQKS